MIWNYILTALRTIRRQKLHSTINIMGLSVGMACAILLLLWIQDELLYDHNHSNADHIYRLTPCVDSSVMAVSPSLLGEYVTRKHEHLTQYVRMTTVLEDLLFVSPKTKHKESDIVFADPTLFTLFSFDFVQGTAETALADSCGIVLTESSAMRYFGRTEVVGESIWCENRIKLTVGAVVRDMPSNTNIRFCCALSLSLFKREFGVDENWSQYNYMTYVLADEAYTPDTDTLTYTYTASAHETPRQLLLQPLIDIHLFSTCDFDYSSNRNPADVWLFGALAAIILLIACINFINLTTARAIKRSKEVGIRKALGASRRWLMLQFYGEAFTFTLVAFFIALGLVELFIPEFNLQTDKNLDIHAVNTPAMLLILFGILGTTTIISGSYPALILSLLPPVFALKVYATANRGGIFRKTLVVFQFAVASLLIICTLTIADQIKYMSTVDKGYSPHKLVSLTVEGRIADSINVVRRQLLQNTNIQSVSCVAGWPLIDPASAMWQNPETQESVWLYFAQADTSFIQTFELEIVEGNNFCDTIGITQYILTREAVRQTGLQPPYEGQMFYFNNDSGVVRGIINNYLFLHLSKQLAPMLLVYPVTNSSDIFAKINPAHTEAVQEYITNVWQTNEPDFPVQITYYGGLFDTTYNSEIRMLETFNVFAVLSVFISCLGLLGTTQFTIEQKTKEIGLRKVFGADQGTIVVSTLLHNTKWVALASLISYPATYWATESWLNGYAFRAPFSIANFLLTTAIVFGISIATVIVLSVRIALQNPASALHHE